LRLLSEAYSLTDSNLRDAIRMLLALHTQEEGKSITPLTEQKWNLEAPIGNGMARRSSPLFFSPDAAYFEYQMHQFGVPNKNLILEDFKKARVWIEERLTLSGKN
jgi:hypothetical protein